MIGMIKFLHPSFLWALWLIAIPVLIHILNLRRHKTVYFSNVDFLKKVRREGKKQSKIKRLIILSCRILAIVFLVMAFARPYRPLSNIDDRSINNISCIYIDNSFSMNAESTEGKAIENAKNKAYAIVQASLPDTKFVLLTNEMSLSQNRFYSSQEMLGLIGEVEVGFQQIEMSKVVDRFAGMTGNFLEQTQKTVYLISDFQKVTTDVASFKPDTVANFDLITIPINKVSNIALDSCYFDTPAHHLKQQEQLMVRMNNHSEEAYRQMSVKLFIDDSLKALATVDIEAGECKIVPLLYTNQRVGFQYCRIEISDYPITYDNVMYFSYNVSDKVRALLINQGRSSSIHQRSIEAVFANDNFVNLDVEQEERLQISQLSDYSTIFLNEIRSYSTGLVESLKKYAEEGGTVVFMPDSKGDVDSYNMLLKAMDCNEIERLDTSSIPVSEIAFDHQIYKGVFKDDNQKVDLPVMGSRFRFAKSNDVFETKLMGFADNSKAISVSSKGKGRVVVFSFQPSAVENHFVEHLVFVPTIFNVVLTSTVQQQLYHSIEQGRPVMISLPPSSQIQSPKIENIEGTETIFPIVKKVEGNMANLFVDHPIKAGLYKLFFDEQLSMVLAFNYKLSESELDFYTPSELLEMLAKVGIEKVNVVSSDNGSFTSTIEALSSGKQFWRLFIMLALLFLLLEAAVIKFWK